MKPLNIALTFPGCHRRGGVERIVFECAKFLAARDHRVSIFAADYEPISHPNITYCQVPMRKRPAFASGGSFFAECSRALETADFDVMNSHGCVCPVGGVHWVQSVHKAWLETCKRFRPPFSVARLRQSVNPLHPALLRLEERHFRDRNFKVLIATTPQVRSDLQTYYGVPPDRVRIVPNGFNPLDFNPFRRGSRRNAQRAALGLTPEQTVLLFVANELERKGYFTILKAMQALKDPSLRLVVIGRPDPAVVMKHAYSYGLAQQVIACGPSSDVGLFHAAADLFVLPTQYEAFCLAILESLGSGLPVVTSSVPGARDAILPGINGALIENPADGEELAQVLRPLLDPTVRQRLQDGAPATVEQYRWPSVLERYEQVLRGHAA